MNNGGEQRKQLEKTLLQKLGKLEKQSRRRMEIQNNGISINKQLLNEDGGEMTIEQKFSSLEEITKEVL